MNELNMFGVVIISTELVLKPVGTTNVVNFSARTVERVKKPNSEEYESVAHFFNFEIWDSGAKYLSENARKGDKLIVHSATPKEHKWSKEENGVVKNFSKVVFRINRFQVFPVEYKETTNA